MLDLFYFFFSYQHVLLSLMGLSHTVSETGTTVLCCSFKVYPNNWGMW